MKENRMLYYKIISILALIVILGNYLFPIIFIRISVYFSLISTIVLCCVLLVFALFEEKKNKLEIITFSAVVLINVVPLVIPIHYMYLNFIRLPLTILFVYVVVKIILKDNKDLDIVEKIKITNDSLETSKEDDELVKNRNTYYLLINYLTSNTLLTLLFASPLIFLYLPSNIGNGFVYSIYYLVHSSFNNGSGFLAYLLVFYVMPFFWIINLLVFLIAYLKNKLQAKKISKKHKSLLLMNIATYFTVIFSLMYAANAILDSYDECYVNFFSMIPFIITLIFFVALLKSTKVSLFDTKELKKIKRKTYLKEYYLWLFFSIVMIYQFSYNITGSTFDDTYITSVLASVALAIFIISYSYNILKKKIDNPNIFEILIFIHMASTYYYIIVYVFGNHYIVCT